MAWRCTRCGQVYEGDIKRRDRVMGTVCPGQRSRFEHEWRYFESAQDKQNKILEEQNELMAAQLRAQVESQKTISSEKQGSSSSKEDKMWQNYFTKVNSEEGRLERVICEHWGVEYKYPNDVLARLVCKHLESILNCDSLFKYFSTASRRCDLVWVLIRDLHLTSSLESSFGSTNTETRDELNSLMNFYEIGNDKIDESILLECADAFAETDFYKENINNPEKSKNNYQKLYNWFYLKGFYSFYPQKYCEHLDELMMEKDGKEKWNDYISKFQSRKTFSRLLELAGIALVIFLLVTCISC